MHKQGDLLKELTAKPQREDAGSDSSNRFAYQRNWALCEMLKRHNSSMDYMVAFEFHDDILFFNSEENPDSVDFFQVKTTKSAKPKKASAYTTRRKNGNSILGKLLLNQVGLCKDHTMKFIVVSNRVFEFSTQNICAKDIDEKTRTKLFEKISAELPGIEESILEQLHFYVSDVPLDEIETFLQGETVNLFKKRFGDDFSFNVLSWLRLIQGEINRKNNTLATDVSTVSELLDKKCISKSFIDGTLNAMEEKHRSVPDLSLIKSELMKDGWTLQQSLSLDKQFPSAVSDYNDPTNRECLEMVALIESSTSSIDVEHTSLTNILEEAYSLLSENGKIGSPYMNKMYVCALIILVYNAKL